MDSSLNNTTRFVFNATPPPPKPPDGREQTGTSSKKISFRDILIEGQQTNQSKEKVDLIAEGLMKVSLEDGNRLLPVVTMDDKLFQDLCNPWKEALVIKLLGKNVGYNMLKDRLKNLWRLTGGFEIMDVDNGFYMVKCELLADREKIISDGPWMLFDHYLAVARWTPDFASPHAKIEKTLVWIRFPGLNLLYYDESVLLGLASVVGTPIKVDTNTLKVERGRFARICVEIDLTLPVVGKVNINGHWYNVQYEGLHTRDCKTSPFTQPPEAQTTKHHGSQPEANVGRKESVVEPSKESANSMGKESGMSHETHGEWLVVQRKKKNIKGNNGQLSSLANKFPKASGDTKGKASHSSLKEANGNTIVGKGPIQQNSNPKKRRLDKNDTLGDSRHPINMWDPRTKGNSTSPNMQHVNVPKHMTRPKNNFDPGPTSPMITTVSTPIHNPVQQEANSIQEHHASLPTEPAALPKVQNMIVGENQDDESVP
jgi:hypothetical protein